MNFEFEIEKALGPYACSDANPCGGTGYVDTSADLPYRVLYSDGAGCESFATAEEAIKAAKEYREEMEATGDII